MVKQLIPSVQRVDGIHGVDQSNTAGRLVPGGLFGRRRGLIPFFCLGGHLVVKGVGNDVDAELVGSIG